MGSISDVSISACANYLVQTNMLPVTQKQLDIATGMFIRNKRLEQSLTGQQLGNALRVSQQQISRYELGVTALNLHQLDQILRILSSNWECFIREVINPCTHQVSL
ncbi:TPA: helix-turn-helix domain-containing protein [Providencia rettgeri]